MAFSAQRALLAAGKSVIQKGYWGGGWNGFNTKNVIQGIDFLTETTVNPAATLSFGRNDLTGSSSGVKGYFAGGFTGVFIPTNRIDGMIFGTDAAFNPAATLATARYVSAGVSSYLTGKGYFAGGNVNFANDTNQIDGIQYSNDAAINPAAVVSPARGWLIGVNSELNGYFAGGKTNVPISGIDGLRFSDETAINPSATLSSPTVATGGCSSPTRGYWAGGATNIFAVGSVYHNKYDGIIFATEVATTPGLVLTRLKFLLTGVSGIRKGYWGGGGNGTAPNFYSDIDSFVYSSELAENVSASLPDGNSDSMGGIQQWPQQ